MSEKLNNQIENERSHAEDLESAGAERRAELEKLRETAEKGHENNVDDARNEALEKAKSVEKEDKVKEKEATTELQTERINHKPSKAAGEASFKATMKEVQSQMSAPSRTFSKIIHNKAIEKTSEVLGSTVARPNAILSGAVFAFIATLSVYIIAKNLGYPLSGFESIGAFAFGWVLGICYDFLKVMITGRTG